MIRRSGRAWVATVIGVPGCIVWGRDLTTTIARVRTALFLLRPGSWRSALAIRYALEGVAGRTVDSALEALAVARKAREDANQALAEAARALRSQGVSRRDSAKLLRISHQRVQQVLAGR